MSGEDVVISVASGTVKVVGLLDVCNGAVDVSMVVIKLFVVARIVS